MQLGDQRDNGKVVFIRGKYYITEIGRPIDDQKLYRVFINSNYWRDQKISQFGAVFLDRAIAWINDRKCFKNKKEEL